MYVVEHPVPAPWPYDEDLNRAPQTARSGLSAHVVTSAGFDDWMKTFKPDPAARNVVEADAEPGRPWVHELLVMPGGGFLLSSY